MARVITTGFETGRFVGTASSHGSPAIVEAGGTTFVRSGRYAARPQSTTTNSGFSYEVSSLEEGYIKFGFYHRGNATTTTYQNILGLADTLNNADVNLNFRLDLSTMKFAVLRYTTAITGGTGTQTIQYNRWYNIEIYWKMGDSSTGRFILKVDGVVDFDVTAQTYVSVGKTVNFIRFGGTSYNAAYDVFIDDVVVNDTTGAEHNSWPGDTRIYPVVPDSPGDVTLLTQSDPLQANYELVNTVPHNDTTFVYTDTAGDYDLYGVDGLSGVGHLGEISVVGVTPVSRAKSTVSDGSMLGSSGIKAGTQELWGPDRVLSEGFTDVVGDFVSTNPATSQPFTTGEIAALQIGFKVTEDLTS